MIITGIEVIRGNPEAVVAGDNPGVLTEATPGEKLELTYGDKLRITTGFEYRGPAHDITLYGSIGQRKAVLGFDEIISAGAKYKTPNSPTTFAPVTASVDIPITADIAPKPDYDIYCKIKEYPGPGCHRLMMSLPLPACRQPLSCWRRPFTPTPTSMTASAKSRPLPSRLTPSPQRAG